MGNSRGVDYTFKAHAPQPKNKPRTVKATQAPPLSKHHLAFDKEVALKYVTWLVEKRIADGVETRVAFCEEAGFHPRLLYENPHIAAIEKLFRDQSSIERLGAMTLREYLRFHRYYLQKAADYGAEGLQPRWLGQAVEKTPWDCWVYQEIIWETRPDFVIELGVTAGGSAHFFASVLDMMDHGEVIGVDVSLARAGSPGNKRIQYIEGSSTAPETLERVRTRAAGKRVLVIADSRHEKNHVLAELEAYAPLVHVGGYFIVEDTLNDVLGFSPVPIEGSKAAAEAFLARTDDFVVDRRWAERYVLTLNPNGFLRRVK
jgi:cephalosporin hydroxylase